MVGLFCCTALHALVLCRFSSCVVIGEVTHRLSTERMVEEIGIEGLSDKFLSHFITFHHQVLDRKCGNERSNTLLQIVQEHHPSELRLLATASRPGGRKLEGTRRLVESLLKASTYSRLFKIIQERGMEWCGVAESRSASFPLHVGPSNNRTHTYPDQILGYGVDQFHCCLSCLKLILSHPESGLTQLNHAQMENMPGLPDSFGHCTDLVGGLAFSMHSARFRFRSCDSSGSYF